MVSVNAATFSSWVIRAIAYLILYLDSEGPYLLDQFPKMVMS
jgi:hypothetical protein